MTINEYQKLAQRTSPDDHNKLLNGCMGLAGECGEVCDVMKKALFQGHALDRATAQPRQDNPAKRYLRRYIGLRKYRDALRDELREHYSTATACTVRLKPIAVSGGKGAYDRMAEDVCQIVDTKARLERAICSLDQQLSDILTLLDGLSDQRYRDVLAYRYIRGMTWEQVARETGYEIAQIYRLHGRALIEVNRALDSR
jgi:DNA-directed RNA polymerase specialized sigma24 family protein